MRYASSSLRVTFLPVLAAVLALSLTLSGCVLFGLGAAAGAAVGGCSLLDDNDDDRVTQAELSSGLFDAWDTNDNGTLTEAEFEAGTDRGDLYAGWSGDFDAWDANGNGTLSESEFRNGVASDSDTAEWLDRQCDDLGL